MQHVDEGLLHAWLDGEIAELGPAVEAEVRRHLDECGGCRARLEEERAIRERATFLLRRDAPAVGEIPPFETLTARGAPARRARTGTMLAWAASLVFAVAAGWLARSTLLAPGPTHAPVAVSPRPAAPIRAPALPSPSAPASSGVTERRPEAAPTPSLRVATRDAAKPGAVSREAPNEAVSAPLAESPPPPPPPPPVAAPPPAPVAESGGGIPTMAAPMAPAAGENATAERSARRAERAGAMPPRKMTADSAPLALEGLVVPAGGVSGEVPDADGWLRVGGKEARRLLGREPLRVRGLRVLAVQAGRRDGRAVVRVRQALESGEILELVQARDLPEGASAIADHASTRDTAAVAPGEPARVVRHMGGVTVTAVAPLPADSLARLLERLR